MSGHDPCPFPDVLDDLAAGRLTEAEAAPVLDHIETCPRCHGLMRGFEPTSRGSTAPAEERRTAPAPGRHPIALD